MSNNIENVKRNNHFKLKHSTTHEEGKKNLKSKKVLARQSNKSSLDEYLSKNMITEKL